LWVRQNSTGNQWLPKPAAPTARHTFKRIADEIGMPEKMSDAITGRTQAAEGRKYGAPAVEACVLFGGLPGK
jgi:hypothetical protein